MAEYSNPEDWPEGYSDIRYIDNLLRCPICFEYLNIAMMLPQCSHNYCSLCIRKYMSVKEKCPTCAIEARDSDLRNNRILDDIIWKFKAVRSTLVNILLSGPTNVLTDSNEGSSRNTFIAAPILGTPDKRPARRKQLMDEVETPTTSGVTRARADSSILSNSQTSPVGSKFSPPPAVLPRSERGVGKPSNNGATKTSSGPASRKVNGTQPVSLESDVESEEEQFTKSRTKRTLPPGRKRKRSVSPPCDVVVRDVSSSEEEFVPKSRDRPKRRREQSQSPPRHDAIADEIPDSTNIQIACPVCGVMIRKQMINIHLDKCLQADCKPIITSSPTKRKKLPKLVYSLVSDKDMKKKLREWGLPVQGDRQMLVRRHHEFTLIFNAECDAVAPRSAAEIVKELQKAEKCKSSFIALSQTKFLQLAYLPLVILQNLKLEKNATEVEIEHAQKQYVKTHKSHFSKLIEEAKKRMGGTRSSRQSSTDTNKSEDKSMDEKISKTKQEDDHSDEELFGRRSKRGESITNWDSVMSDKPNQSSSKRLQSKGLKEKDDSDADDLFGSDKQMDTAPPLPSWGAIMDVTEDKEDKNRSAKAVCNDEKDSEKREDMKDVHDTGRTWRKTTMQNKQSSSGVVEDSPDELTIVDDSEQRDSEHEVEKPSISSRRKVKGKRKKRIPRGRKPKVQQISSSADDSDSEGKTTMQNKQSSSGVVEDSPDELTIVDHSEQSDSEHEVDKSSISSRGKAKGKLKKRIPSGRKPKVEQKSSSADDSDSESDGAKLGKATGLQKKQPDAKKNALRLKIPDGTRRSQRDCKVDIDYCENKKANKGVVIENESKDGSLSEDDTVRETVKRVRGKPIMKDTASRNSNVKKKVSDKNDMDIIDSHESTSEDEPRSRNTENISKRSHKSLRQKGHGSRVNKFLKSRGRKYRGKDDLDADDDNGDSSSSESSCSDDEKEEEKNVSTKSKHLRLEKKGKPKISKMYEDGEKKGQSVEDEDDLSDGNKKNYRFRKHKKADTSVSIDDSGKRRKTNSENKESDSNSDQDSHVKSASEDETKEERNVLEERSEINNEMGKDSIINDEEEKVSGRAVDSDTGFVENDDDSHKNNEDESNQNIERLLPTTESTKLKNRDADVDASYSGDSTDAEEITIGQSIENISSAEPEKRDEIMMTLSLPSPKPVKEVDMFVDDSPVSAKSMSDEIDNLIDKVTTYAKDCETDNKETEDATSEMMKTEAVDVESAQ